MFSSVSAPVCLALAHHAARIVLGLSMLTIGIGSAYAESALAFDIDVTLSSKAAARLKATHEGVSILASFYGDPTAAGEDQVNELGTVDLASVQIEVLGGAGRAHIGGEAVSAARLDWVSVPMVNVNIFSSRKASAENILDCDFIDGPVQDVVKLSPVPLRCWLIEEQAASKMYP